MGRCSNGWWQGDLWQRGSGGATPTSRVVTAAALVTVEVLVRAAVLGTVVARQELEVAVLVTAPVFLFLLADLVASGTRWQSLRRGGTLAGGARGGGWSEWSGCSGNARRWLP